MTRLEQISELADLQNRLLRAAENVASELRDLSFGCEDDDQEEDVSSPILKAVMDDLICFSINRVASKNFPKINAAMKAIRDDLKGAIVPYSENPTVKKPMYGLNPDTYVLLKTGRF